MLYPERFLFFASFNKFDFAVHFFFYAYKNSAPFLINVKSLNHVFISYFWALNFTELSFNGLIGCVTFFGFGSWILLVDGGRR